MTRGLPAYLRNPLHQKWSRIRKSAATTALRDANLFVRGFMARVPELTGALPLELNDDDIGVFARKAADECAQILSLAGSGAAVPVLVGTQWIKRPRFALEALAKAASHGVLPELAGIRAKNLPAWFETTQKRLADVKWWRGRLKRLITRAVEQHLVRLGCVNDRGAPYVSNGTLKRLAHRDQKTAIALELAEATNEKGQTYTLAELSRRTVANPEIRRTELMVRIRGTEEVMQELGMVGYFVTITAPSKYHASSPKYGKPYTCAADALGDDDAVDLGPNAEPRFVRKQYSPRDTQTYLCTLWKQARALFKKKANSIQITGVRVAEPHHDGTPHWHMLIWVAPHQADRMLAILQGKAFEVDGEEKGAAKHRFTVEKIDPRKGSAVGYVAKYLAKNIDGAFVDVDHDTGLSGATAAQRAVKWASCHRIRQFQMFGVPPVTVWRELRKADLLAEDNRDELVLHNLHAAADRADWAAYTRFYDGLLGGYRVGFEPLREADKSTGELIEPINKYGETTFVRNAVALFSPANEVIERIQTRMHEWSVEWRRDGEAKRLQELASTVVFEVPGFEFERSGAAASTWTRVNNCNQSPEIVELERKIGEETADWNTHLPTALHAGEWDKSGRWHPRPPKPQADIDFMYADAPDVAPARPTHA
ncbi:hypothetical protein HNQ50_002815 [Silvimonas terrae]|uniref:Replication gene A protein-like domain-containing protein n=1 Tax=Silvimonas terrae TaxID=300266 RepID=A0A840RHS6_9NEIS|nr:replication endonuclease [Silvimonas terrae]MBB5192078.1 hypothetical protein [Silvimonas terrae]